MTAITSTHGAAKHDFHAQPVAAPLESVLRTAAILLIVFGIALAALAWTGKIDSGSNAAGPVQVTEDWHGNSAAIRPVK